MNRGTRRAIFSNPFFVLMLVTSTAFVITTLAYAVGPSVVAKAEREQTAAERERSLAVVDWFNRRGPLTLGIEIGVIILSGTIAMLTDHWFSRDRGSPHGGCDPSSAA